ncbi:MAG TPA: FAD-binding oxidoreductase, partial [Pseudobdellovibrionaceae bacterium]|nr:FAD-binding oxidoreductase [Pseudobdellovibrionaceae bacterium]
MKTALKDSQIQELTKIFGVSNVKTDSESLKYYGKDWTTYYDISSSAIVFPETTEQVSQLVKWARQEKIPLVPSGGRTGLSGGACATSGEVIVSFEKMNRIKEFDPIDQTVQIEA